jgi:hypothetical protein
MEFRFRSIIIAAQLEIRSIQCIRLAQAILRSDHFTKEFEVVFQIHKKLMWTTAQLDSQLFQQ